jgi:hypothetical protein
LETTGSSERQFAAPTMLDARLPPGYSRSARFSTAIHANFFTMSAATDGSTLCTR